MLQCEVARILLQSPSIQAEINVDAFKVKNIHLLSYHHT
jgi:hypothetical protein